MSDASPAVTWEQVLAWRLRRHHLVDRAAVPDLLQVIGDICGLHAQLLSSAALSLWARVDGLDREVLTDLLWQRRALVKLWAMRGTLHLLPSTELDIWLAALGTQTKYGNVGNAQIDELANAIRQALDGRELTRAELAIEVEQLTGSAELGEWVRFSWGSYLKAASFRGLLCFAESAGSNVRFAIPSAWVPGGIMQADPDEALRTVTRRFLAAYGPTTAENIGRWWGGYGVTQGKRMLAMLGEGVVDVELEGSRAWVLADDVPELLSVDVTNVARLLPAFDPWVIGATRRVDALLDQRYVARVYRPQGWISPVLLVNGRMAGVWKHDRKGQRLVVDIEPFSALPAWVHHQVEDEVGRLATFLDGEPSVTWRDTCVSPAAG